LLDVVADARPVDLGLLLGEKRRVARFHMREHVGGDWDAAQLELL
jgi:hypothetical protein